MRLLASSNLSLPTRDKTVSWALVPWKSAMTNPVMPNSSAHCAQQVSTLPCESTSTPSLSNRRALTSIINYYLPLALVVFDDLVTESCLFLSVIERYVPAAARNNSTRAGTISSISQLMLKAETSQL